MRDRSLAAGTAPQRVPAMTPRGSSPAEIAAPRLQARRTGPGHAEHRPGARAPFYLCALAGLLLFTCARETTAQAPARGEQAPARGEQAPARGEQAPTRGEQAARAAGRRITVPRETHCAHLRGPDVTFQNLSRQRLLLLPEQLQLQVTGPGARFVVFPGPARAPWARAFALAPGASQRLRWQGDGIFQLPAGATLRGSGSYDTREPNLLHGATGLPRGTLWRGALQLAAKPFSTPAAGCRD